MKKQNVFENVTSIRFLDGFLYFIGNSTSLNLLEGSVSFTKTISVTFNIKNVFKIDGKIILTDSSNCGYKVIGEFVENIKEFTFDSVSENLELAISTEWISFEPVEVKNYIFDIKNPTLNWEVDTTNLRFEKDLLISKTEFGMDIYSPNSKNILLEIKILDEKYNWSELNYKNELTHHKAEIRRIIGVQNGTIWIGLNSGRLIGINAKDGSHKYDVFEITTYNGKKNLFAHYDPEIASSKDWALFLLQYAQLDEESGVIFGLRNFYYFELDLNDPTNSFTVYDASESFLENQIEADMTNGYEWTWHKDEIFFGHNFTANNNLGIFNRTTKKVTWATRLEQENGQARNISKIEFGSDRLYVLDQLKTLHVFDRN